VMIKTARRIKRDVIQPPVAVFIRRQVMRVQMTFERNAVNRLAEKCKRLYTGKNRPRPK
jgi:hypothetical protein